MVTPYLDLTSALNSKPELYTAYTLATIRKLSSPLPLSYFKAPRVSLLTVSQYLSLFLSDTTKDGNRLSELVRDPAVKSAEGTSAWRGQTYLYEGLGDYIKRRLLVTG